MLTKKILYVLALTVFFGLIPKSYALVPQNLEAKRALFLQAETALTKGKIQQYQKLKTQLTTYPLYPYLLFAEYEGRMTHLSLSEFQEFMDTYSDSPLVEQLRTQWLSAKAKKEDWHAFLRAYQPTENVSLQCNYLWAGLQTHHDPKTILKQITHLWLSGKERPKTCDALFARWEQSELMTRPLIWQRVKLLIQEGNDALARKTARYLKEQEAALVELWLMIRRNPNLVTHKKYFTGTHPAYLEMIVDGVSLIAKNKPENAIKIWQQIAHQYPFAERHWGLVVRAIGLSYAFQKHKDSEKWLSKVPHSYVNRSVHEWRVRVSLLKEDWPNVLHWIKIMPDHLSKEEEWQYWNARALEMVNHRDASQGILAKLAKSRSYYGFLASHQVLKPYTFANQKMNIEPSLLNTIANRPSVLRARELHLLGRFEKARSEWQFITSRMSDKERHTAAKLALERWSLPNWSIYALSEANCKDDLLLRFPVVYARHILNEAERHSLDPAWILAITRQESAFVPHAKSSAGAIGLMQLIPSTAHMVAKQKRIPYKNSKELLKPHTNIQLGSGYLKMMLETNQNNAVLATAAYNAGPGRIRKWLPTFDMSADIWIETIPYKETREYVKNVLTYTAIYQEILGKKPSLHKHMPFIPSAKN